MVRINSELEALIRRAPEQYLWIHDRYRTQPKVGDAGAGDAPGGDDMDDDGAGA